MSNKTLKGRRESTEFISELILIIKIKNKLPVLLKLLLLLLGRLPPLTEEDDETQADHLNVQETNQFVYAYLQCCGSGSVCFWASKRGTDPYPDSSIIQQK
jgi:hypothetical protein